VLYRFGPCVLDTKTWELTRDGTPTGLPPQPVRALAFLVERAGDLVTREELRDHLWPGTFVEFDQGLNSCILKIRRALADSADTPRYVQTLPGRGYRFVCPVTSAGDEPLEQAAAPPPTRRRMVTFVAATLTLAVAATAAWNHGLPGAGNGSRIKLAVLPFENLDAAPENEYLRVALTDEVITRLASLDPARLGVIARTSAMRFDGTGDTPESIGATLGVEYLLLGSIRGSGDTVRIVSQLVRVDDGTHVWAHGFDRGRNDLLDLERELATRVARSLTPTLLPGTAPVSPAQVLPRATYATYLKARFFLTRGGPEGPEKSIPLLEAVVRAAPEYGRALSDLGVAYARVRRYEEARRSALLALRVDSTDAEAHVLMANIALRVDWDPETAETHHRLALEFAPESPLVNHSYAAQLATRGDHKAVARYLHRTLEVDPVSPSVNADLGWHFFRARRYEEALHQCRITLELVPGSEAARSCLLHASLRLGRLAEARTLAMGLMQSQGADSSFLASVGTTAAAGAVQAYFLWRADRVSSDPDATEYDRALALADAGLFAEAQGALEESLHRREHDLVFAGSEPRFEALRQTTAFRRIVEATRAGHPEASSE